MPKSRIAREVDEILSSGTGKTYAAPYPLLRGPGLWHHRVREAREQIHNEREASQLSQRAHATKIDRRKIRYVLLAWSDPQNPNPSRRYVEASFPEDEVLRILEGLYKHGIDSVTVEDRDFSLVTMEGAQAAARHAQASVAGRKTARTSRWDR